MVSLIRWWGGRGRSWNMSTKDKGRPQDSGITLSLAWPNSVLCLYHTHRCVVFSACCRVPQLWTLGWDWIILCCWRWEVVLGIVECRTASLASTHSGPVASPQLWQQQKLSPDIACQQSPGGRGQESLVCRKASQVWNCGALFLARCFLTFPWQGSWNPKRGTWDQLCK